MRQRGLGALGPLLTLLALPAAAYAAEGRVAPADTFAQLAALIALLLGAMVAGYFFVRPFARVRGWMRIAMRIGRHELDPKPEDRPPQTPVAEAPPTRTPWSTEPPGGRWPVP